VANWAATVVAAIALIVSVINMVLQNRLGSAQKELAGKQVALSERTAKVQHELAIAHSGAQTAMEWRNQILVLHDRGLEPDEIRWIMCCEDCGIGHEEWNGFIDEVVGNVPRVPPPGMIASTTRSDYRRLRRPAGYMRADIGQAYDFPVEHRA